MEKVFGILRSLCVSFRFEDDEFVIDSVGGNIFEMDGNIFFICGNRQPCIPVDDANLGKWVKAYTDGREPFEDVLRSA